MSTAVVEAAPLVEPTTKEISRHQHKILTLPFVLPYRAVKHIIFFRRKSSRKGRDLPVSEKLAIEVVPAAESPSSSSASSTDVPVVTVIQDNSGDDEDQEAVAAAEDGSSFHLPSPTQTPQVGTAQPMFVIDKDKAGIASLIAEYGSSSSTSWLEFSRYKIWRPTVPVPESSFVPVQGYLRNDPYIFAWGNPLVSDKAALAPTAAAFWNWARSQNLKLVWCGADGDLEAVLGKDPRFGWAALTCIVEDVLDPAAVVELAQANGNSGASEVKDFKKNLRRAERENVTTREMRWAEWSEQQKKEVEDGILAWKKAKAKTGLQLASTSFMPWLDNEHRRYFIAEHEGHVVGILILTQIHHDQYQIKNQAMFPGAPRGTSEWLIFNAMQTLANEEGSLLWERDGERAESIAGSSEESSHGHSEGQRHGRASVTFGITASASITPVDNLSGWKISWLSTTYNKVVGSTGLTRRGDFRSKFHTEHQPMYVCYPAKQGFGLDGVSKLIKSLRQ